MTTISYVTAKEMKQRTGLGRALGYAFPKEDEILIRKGLTKKKKKEVLAHEEDHIAKGEEGPFWNIVIPAAASILGGAMSSSAAGKAADTAAAGSAAEIAFNRESRDLAREDQRPYREAGYTALDALMSMTGLGRGTRPAATDPTDSPHNDPAAGGPRRTLGSQPFGGQRAARALESAYGEQSAREARSIQSRYDIPSYRDYELQTPDWWTIGRAGGGSMRALQPYNVNELGPEDVYEGGAMTRHPMPRTITSNGGYVHPNQGRATGGFTGIRRTPIKDYSDSGIPGVGMIPFDGNLSGGPDAMPAGNVTGYTQPQENPGGVEGGYNFMTDPGYAFRFNEGQRALEAGAAARGGLLSGGFAKKAMRYGQDYASNEYTNVYNRISNIAGLGQVSAGQAGQAALYGGAQMGRAASEGANSSAYGQIAQGNAWANSINEIAQLPWGDAIKNWGGKP